MKTAAIMLSLALLIGFFARSYNNRTRTLLCLALIFGISLLYILPA